MFLRSYLKNSLCLSYELHCIVKLEFEVPDLRIAMVFSFDLINQELKLTTEEMCLYIIFEVFLLIFSKYIMYLQLFFLWKGHTSLVTNLYIYFSRSWSGSFHYIRF